MKLRLSFSKIISLFQLQGRDFPTLSTRAARDWRLVLLSALLMTILVVAFNLLLFVKVSKGEVFVIKQGSDAVQGAIDENLLRQTLSRFEERAAILESLKTRPVSLPDPSR
ncbi:hypothetical protein EPN83_03240 [Patescibacteria group bacterium]|nr:MAG: hypothetical protein EPN83_03240 [Patescibacteria group bacterium]